MTTAAIATIRGAPGPSFHVTTSTPRTSTSHDRRGREPADSEPVRGRPASTRGALRASTDRPSRSRTVGRQSSFGNDAGTAGFVRGGAPCLRRGPARSIAGFLPRLARREAALNPQADHLRQAPSARGRLRAVLRASAASGHRALNVPAPPVVIPDNTSRGPRGNAAIAIALGDARKRVAGRVARFGRACVVTSRGTDRSSPRRAVRACACHACAAQSRRPRRIRRRIPRTAGPRARRPPPRRINRRFRQRPLSRLTAQPFPGGSIELPTRQVLAAAMAGTDVRAARAGRFSGRRRREPAGPSLGTGTPGPGSRRGSSPTR